MRVIHMASSKKSGIPQIWASHQQESSRTTTEPQGPIEVYMSTVAEEFDQTLPTMINVKRIVSNALNLRSLKSKE